MRLKTKKGIMDSLDGLRALIIGIGVIGVTIVVVLLILANTKSQVISQEGLYPNGTTIASSGALMGSAAYNATVQTVQATGQVPTWLPIIIIVAIGGVLIYLVMRFRERT